jgi:hypothetical protein
VPRSSIFSGFNAPPKPPTAVRNGETIAARLTELVSCYTGAPAHRRTGGMTVI